MDKSIVEEIVNSNVERLKKLLGLQSWEFVFEYDSFPEDTIKGSCDSLVERQIAIIVLDPKMMETKADVIEILTHELIHCITSTFHTYKAAVSCLIDSGNTLDAIGVIFTRAEEETVSRFCRILERMQAEPKTPDVSAEVTKSE